MSRLSLGNRILIASAAIFIVFFAAFMQIHFRSQTRLTIEEMDRLLQNESLTISSLVNLDGKGQIDFEFSKIFLVQYQQLKFSSFFRFFEESSGTTLRESPNAPKVRCDGDKEFESLTVDGVPFRTLSYRFQPDFEVGRTSLEMPKPWLCLIVGTDERPYRQLVLDSILATFPFLAGLFIASLLILSKLIKALTSDLTKLTTALSEADFGVTRSFPELPETGTAEVNAVVEKLAILHHQAASVYDEMILFLARAAHQLKTPVTAIQATLEVLVRKERTKDELLVGLSDLGIGVRQMGQLTHKLISSTRISYEPIPDLKGVDLIAFFEGQKKLFQYQAEKQQIAIVIAASEMCKVKGDEQLLSEIFGNLVENALLYSGFGARVRISWKVDEEKAKVSIRIEDNGPGFSKDVKDNLFRPFTRGDERQTSGSGLGLSIVKAAAFTLQGTVRLMESSEKGSTLEVTLPLFRET